MAILTPSGSGAFQSGPETGFFQRSEVTHDADINQSDEVLYHSFSGTDITAVIVLPNETRPMALGELQTISYSMHRENTPVRTLGHVNPRGFVKGPRTIAGSLIFYQFNQYAFYRLDQFRKQVNRGLYALADMMPPFDIVISYSNEYGAFAKSKIYGVTIVDEGGTMSVDDLVTEQTFTYMARGFQPLTAYVPVGFSREGPTASTEPIFRPRLTFFS